MTGMILYGCIKTKLSPFMFRQANLHLKIALRAKKLVYGINVIREMSKYIIFILVKMNMLIGLCVHLKLHKCRIEIGKYLFYHSQRKI